MGTSYSLAHYYEQESDSMRAPEMCFVMVDNRQQADQYSMIGIYPTYFLQDDFGIEQISILFLNKIAAQICDRMQRRHAVFANQWLRAIQREGFLG
ncbi:MAG: hypothetical protein P4L51_23665 [Puia sp.]|nr:hypothetical protein [Puia sp.]